MLTVIQKEKNNGRPQGRNDQQYGGGNPYVQQQPYAQQGAPAQGVPAADPYAQYGGYEAYTALWSLYLQGQAATGGAGQAPQPQ